MPDASPFRLFVSCVPGALVTRYGTRSFIGAERTGDAPQTVAFHPDRIVALTHQECRLYRREYDRALRDGSLRRRTPDEWKADQAPPTRPTGGSDAGTRKAKKR